jgi:hypothetical protein
MDDTWQAVLQPRRSFEDPQGHPFLASKGCQPFKHVIANGLVPEIDARRGEGLEICLQCGWPQLSPFRHVAAPQRDDGEHQPPQLSCHEYASASSFHKRGE